MLSGSLDVLKTEANYNNHVGLPHMLFQLREGHEIAVLEIGTNHPGEIDWLARVAAPTHALITNIGREHLEFFGSVAILPQHSLAAAAREKRFPNSYAVNTRPDKIIGSGPYRVKEIQPGKFTLLEANPEYWMTDKQGRRLPYFDEILFTSVGRQGSDVALFLAGKSDVCETLRAENLPQVKQAATSGKFKLLELGVGTERDFIWFNQNTGINPAGKPLVNPACRGDTPCLRE